MPLECLFKSHAPAWWGGCPAPGIHGLAATAEGTVYYMLSCEAEAVFLDLASCRARRYRMEGLGPGPWRGGDGWNAAAAVDDTVFFAGWASTYNSGGGERRLIHVHAYKESREQVELLWAREAAGEVRSLIYNPARGTLVLALGGGYPRPGVYELPLEGGRPRLVAPIRVSSGVWSRGMLCFAHEPSPGKAPSLTCLDPVDYRGVSIAVNTGEASLDGSPLPQGGVALAAETGLGVAVVTQGGLVAADPGGEARAYRFMDVDCLEPVPGGSTAAPSGPLLLYRPRGRCTGGGGLVARLSAGTAEVLSQAEGRPCSAGYVRGRAVAAWSSPGGGLRVIAPLPERPAGAAVFRARLGVKPRLGVPATEAARLHVYVSKPNTLRVIGYLIGVDEPVAVEEASLSPGRNTLELGHMRGLLVAASLAKEDPGAYAVLIA